MNAVTATSPHGMIEPGFDTCALLSAAGASFVARATVYHVIEMDGLIRQALEKKGFSVVEALSPCPTNYGRANRLGDAVKMMEDMRDNSVTVTKAAKMTPEELSGKIVRGVLAEREAPEYTDLYRELCERVQGKAAEVPK